MRATGRGVLAVFFVLTMFTAVHGKEFPVGVEGPLTGAMARVGTGTTEGIKVATEVFNRKNPKHQMKLQIINDESEHAKAVSAVEKLAASGVVGMIGAYGSGLIAVGSAAAEKLNLVYITSGGSTKELTTRGFKKFFSIVNGEGYCKITTSLLRQLKAKSVSVVYNTKESSNEQAGIVVRDLKAAGVKVTMHPFDPSNTEFKPIVNKVKYQDKSEILYMCGQENDYIGILRAAKVLKPEVKAVIGCWGVATAKMINEFPNLMPNVIGTSMVSFPAKFNTAEGREMEQVFQKMYHKEPDYLTVYGYTTAMILFEAIKRADEKGTLSKGGLADEVRRTDRMTLMGPVAFNERGENNKFTQRMGQCQTGKIDIIWPRDDATGKMKYPGVPW